MGKLHQKSSKTIPSVPVAEIYSVQCILLGKHGSGVDCSAGEARREEKQDFSSHHFSQLLTKPPALQGPSSPELEAFRQPARAFAPSPGSLQGNLPDDSEQTVVRAFLPYKGKIFLSAHLHQGLSRKQKLKDRQIKALEVTETPEHWQSQDLLLMLQCQDLGEACLDGGENLDYTEGHSEQGQLPQP